MSYLVDDHLSALFRAHSTSNQSGMGAGTMFEMHFASQCGIDGSYQVTPNRRAFLYGEVQAYPTYQNASFDASFSQFESLESQGWQVSPNLNLWQMNGDDGMYAVSNRSTGLIVRTRYQYGSSDSEQARIFGVRTA